MIQYYIFDANNLIAKIPAINNLSNDFKRQKLCTQIEKFFSGKSIKISIHFDGFPNNGVSASKAHIFYSNNKKADDLIRDEIACAKNHKIIAVISSDRGITDFARVCGCKIISSEAFAKKLNYNNKDFESEKIREIDNEEIKKLFGVK